MDCLCILLCSIVPTEQQIIAGMQFVYAHPNPYRIRIPAKRYTKFRIPPQTEFAVVAAKKFVHAIKKHLDEQMNMEGGPNPMMGYPENSPSHER